MMGQQQQGMPGMMMGQHGMQGMMHPGGGMMQQRMPVPVPVSPEVLAEQAKVAAAAEAERLAKEEERTAAEEVIRKEKEEDDAKVALIIAAKAEKDRLKKEFKILLLEKGVTPGAGWDAELAKFCYDPRYKLIEDLSERKAVFQTYTRGDVVRYKEEQKKLLVERKGIAMKVAKELLVSAKTLTQHSTVETFWEEFGDDERVTVLDRTDKKLVQLVHLFVEPLKSQAREHQGEQRADFRAGLGKDTSLNVDSTFKRWRSLVDAGQANGGPKDLLWEAKEGIFKEHVKGLSTAAPDRYQDMAEKRREERKRLGLDQEAPRGEREGERDRERDSHRERDSGRDRDRERRRSPEDLKRRRGDSPARERESKEPRAGEQRKDTRRKSKKEQAEEDFQELLTRHAKDATQTWKEARSILRKQDTYEACGAELSSKERETLFDKHVAALLAAIQAAFKEAVENMAGLSLHALWDDVQDRVEALSDSFLQLSSRTRERTFKKVQAGRATSLKRQLATQMHDSLPEICMQMDLENRGSIPSEVTELEAYKKLDELPQEERLAAVWEAIGEMQRGKKRERQRLEEKMASGARGGDAKRSRQNLASYVDTPKDKE